LLLTPANSETLDLLTSGGTAGRSTDNPVRDRMIVKMPREERHQVQPPTAEHVEAAVRLLPSRYRLATLVLDATGMRVGELEALSWGDLDEPRARWRIATSKTGRLARGVRVRGRPVRAPHHLRDASQSLEELGQAGCSRQRSVRPPLRGPRLAAAV
jgi:integrase